MMTTSTLSLAHRALLAACAGTWLLTVAGCGSGSDDDQVTAASATIDAAGGTLTGPDGIQVTVPPGALNGPTTIRIARTDVGAPAGAPDGYTPTGPVYEITPHGLTFHRPVSVTMPAATLQGAEANGVFAASPGEDWRAQAADLADGKARWDTMSFSWFLMAGCLPNASDPYTCVWPRIQPQLTATPAAAVTPFIDGVSLKAWNVTQAATLRMALNVTAAADCLLAPRVTVRPRTPTTNGTALYGDPVFDQEIVLQADPANVKHARQTVNWDFSLSSADNGSRWYWVQFSCGRLATGKRQSISGYAVFVVDAPPPLPLPAFTAQPVDASVIAPEAGNFSVTAIGDPVPGVQWQRSNDGGATWAPIPGATGASYTTPATTLADDGSQYRAVATNAGGSVTSSAARLTVTAPAGGTWQAALTVAAAGGNFHPSTAFDGSGRALAVWNALPTGSTVARTYFSSGSVAGGWSAPQQIDGAFSNGFEARIAVAPDGRAVAVWGYSAGNQYHLAASRFDGGAWAAPVRIDAGSTYNASEHRVAIDVNGRAVVTWYQFDGSSYGVYASIDDGRSWSPPARIDRGLNAGGPSLSLNAQGLGFVQFVETSDTVVATPIDLGSGFGTPQAVRPKGRSVGVHRVAVDGSGAALSVWVDFTLEGDKLRWSRFIPGAGWSAAADLADNVGAPWDRNLALAANDGGDAILAWSQIDEQRDEVVLTRRFSPAGGWQPSERRSLATVGRDYAETPRVALNANGRAVVTWLQYDAQASIYQVWGQVYDGAWRAAQRLSTAANDSDNDAEHGLALSADSTALSLWVEYPGVGDDDPLLGAFWD